jgi:hypothetical protein
MPGKTRQVFLVVSRWWFFNDEFTTWGDDRPLKAFSDRAQAEAHRERCEEEARAREDREDPSGTCYEVVAVEVEVEPTPPLPPGR